MGEQHPKNDCFFFASTLQRQGFVHIARTGKGGGEGGEREVVHIPARNYLSEYIFKYFHSFLPANKQINVLFIEMKCKR